MDLNDIPQGAVTAIAGVPGSGKTWVALDAIGRMQNADADGIAVVFDTSWRIGGSSYMEQFDVDPGRTLVYAIHEADELVKVMGDLDRLCIDGMPLRMVVVSDLTSVMLPCPEPGAFGARASGMSVLVRRMAEMSRRHNISLSLLVQVRREMGAGFHYKPSPEGIRDTVDYLVMVDRGQVESVEKVERDSLSQGEEK